MTSIASKQKRIHDIVFMLEKGMETKAILHKLAQSCTKSVRTFKSEIKEAKTVLAERNKHKENIRQQQTSETLIEAIKQGLKSNIEIEQRLLQIGWAEIDVEETTNSEQYGITTFKRKPTPAEQRAALDTVLKIRGGFAPSKVAQTDTAGNDKEFNITLNIA